MIKIEKITISEFRGIKKLTLNLNGQNFAACGPNGTGKSGIVDAIEFALTGNVSRLAGSGTGGLSVKDHGPHVDSRNKPEQAWVELEISIPSLGGKKATIKRTVKAARAPEISPKDPAIIAALDDVKAHPEFVLSRRELIRYVISEPGERAKEVQALLRLDDVEKLRVVLQRICNGYQKELAPLERAEKDATTALSTALGVAQLSKSEILPAINQRRQTLGLPPLTEIHASISVLDGLATAGGAPSHAIAKAQITADLEAVKKAASALMAESVAAECTAMHEIAAVLANDPVAASGVTRDTMLNAALELFDENVCPVCDKPFNADEFRAHIKEKLGHLKEINKARKDLEQQISALLDLIHALGSALKNLATYGPQFTPPVDLSKIGEIQTTLRVRYAQLQKFLPLADTAKVLADANNLPDFTAALSPLEIAISALPEPTTVDAARDYLTVAQERFTFARDARQKHTVGKARAGRAEKVFSIYGTSTTAALQGIYDNVQQTFASYYSEINKDDEAAFTAKLIPSLGKLGFDVDFYGRGHFPPGAYHSEGHQDGMGLCLYLALMNHLLGNKFTFSVLDDVLMSVDKGHRREVCALLKTRFPDTQFIFTTHDDVWLRHMKSEGIIKGKNSTIFKTWTVDTGPVEWSNADVWEEIAAHLAKNEVSPASAVLRRYLEYFFGEASHRLRGTVEYRGDNQYALGEVLMGAISALGKAFKAGKTAANSWGQKDKLPAIEAQEAAFDTAKAKANVDQWQLNATVHYNPWADLSKEDFAPVVTAYKELTICFSCDDCGEMYALQPERGDKDMLRCGCGKTAINLKKK